MITNGEVLIRVEDVQKVFGGALHALNGITTEIRKGEVVGCRGTFRFRQVHLPALH